MPDSTPSQPYRADPERHFPVVKFLLAVIVFVPSASYCFVVWSEVLHGHWRGLPFALVILAAALLSGTQILRSSIRFGRGPEIPPDSKTLEDELLEAMPVEELVARSSRTSQVLVINRMTRTLKFEHFQFVSTYASNPTLEHLELPFSALVGMLPAMGRNPRVFGIRTTRGQVEISSHLDRFEELEAVIEAIIRLNRADPIKYQENLNAEPVVKTHWTGWLILAAALGAIIYLGWKFMYAE